MQTITTEKIRLKNPEYKQIRLEISAEADPALYSASLTNHSLHFTHKPSGATISFSAFGIEIFAGDQTFHIILEGERGAIFDSPEGQVIIKNGVVYAKDFQKI